MQAVKCLAALFIPFFYSGRGGANSLDMKPGVLIGIHGFMFLGWLIFLIANVGQRGLCMIGWILYVAYGFHMAYCRMAMRQKRVRLQCTCSLSMLVFINHLCKFTFVSVLCCVLALRICADCSACSDSPAGGPTAWSGCCFACSAQQDRSRCAS